MSVRSTLVWDMIAATSAALDFVIVAVKGYDRRGEQVVVRVFEPRIEGVCGRRGEWELNAELEKEYHV